MRSTFHLIKKTYKMAGTQERKVVLNNFAVLSVLQALTYVLPIIILPYLFRTLGPEKFGLISFAQAFVQYFIILTDYGFNISATKEISLCQNDHARVRRIFSAVMTLKAVLALVSLVILGTVVYFVPKFRGDWLVYVLSYGVVAGNTLFPGWFFQGTEKMKYIAHLNILGGLLLALSIFLTVRGPQDYLMVPLVSSAVSLITGLLGQSIASRKLGAAFRFPESEDLRQQIKTGWDVFISLVAVNAYTTTRIFAIGLLTNNTLTGFYSIAEKIAGMFQAFPLVSFSQALFPRLSKICYKSKARAYKFMRRIQRVTTNFSLICHPLLFIFAHVVVNLVCGGDYYETVWTLRLLIISVFFINANAFRVQFLLVCGRTDIYSRIHLVMALIGVPLIFILIHSLSYVGAAIATVVIEAGVFTATSITLKRLKFS